MHVVVAGGGIFGQVIAWRLSLRGARVTVVEPVGPGSAGSGSGDRSRIVRALYDEPFFAEAGFHGLRLWDEWSALLGVRCVERIGVVYLVRKEGAGAKAFRNWVARGIGHVRALGGDVQELSPAEVTRRWPAMASADLHSAAFEPDGGYGRAALATRAIARAGAATARVVHLAARAVGVCETAGRASGIRWETNDSSGVIEADLVVVASGFAGVELIAPFCGRLPIQRLVHWTSYWDVPYPEGAALHQSVLPAWADLGAELYGFPDDGESGFKAASHAPRPPCAAPASSDSISTADTGQFPPATSRSFVRSGVDDGPPPPPSEAEIEALRAQVAVRFPAIEKGRCRGTYTCAYDATADERFQIGPVPGVSGLWFVGGMSGHGFKHAPSLGDSVAAAVMGQPPMLDLSPYALRAPANSMDAA